MKTMVVAVVIVALVGCAHVMGGAFSKDHMYMSWHGYTRWRTFESSHAWR